MTDFIRFGETKPGEALTFLVYGESGTGKTEFAASYGDRTLFIDIGAGTETMRSPGFIKRKGKFNGLYINLVENLGKGGFFEKATMFDEVCDAMDEGLEKYKDDFDLVVIDDVSAFRRGAMNKALEISSAERGSQTLGRAKKTHIALTAPGDYFVEMEIVEKTIAAYIDKFKEAKKHFMMLAHEKWTFKNPSKLGEEPVLVKTRPAFTGKAFPSQVLAYFDEVYNFYLLRSGTPVFKMHTVGSNAIAAKSRHGVPTDINVPSLKLLIECIQKGDFDALIEKKVKKVV